MWGYQLKKLSWLQVGDTGFSILIKVICYLVYFDLYSFLTQYFTPTGLNMIKLFSVKCIYFCITSKKPKILIIKIINIIVELATACISKFNKIHFLVNIDKLTSDKCILLRTFLF